jgi:hypothetical protein
MNSFLVRHKERNRFSPSQHPAEKAPFAGLKEEGGLLPRPGSTRTKPSRFVLAAAVLTAASLLAPFARAATEYLMPKTDGVQPFDPHPAAPGSLTRQFLTYGVDSDGNHIPLKTLRISNNTAQTVYPIMRDPNSATTSIKEGRKTVGLYDPYDPINEEYRGYIGYEEGGKYYFGLKPGQSILVSVPLVLWNGARIGVGTDGQYLTPSGIPNPQNWDANGQRSIVGAETSGDTIPNGVVMWYRADIAQAPADDNEDQLAEWTIRDHGYLVNPQITTETYNEIPDGQLVTLMNWDVSNVDNLYLPLALEANDVWVVPQSSGPPPNGSRNDWSPGSDPDVTGWTGATNTIKFLQDNIKEFTGGNQLLGQYFGTKGWPHYNIPNPTNDPNAPIKIPGGANIYAQSPLKGVRGSYYNGTWQSTQYMLSSGGSAPIETTIGWPGGTPDLPGSTILHVSLVHPEKFAFLHDGDLVKGNPPASPPTPNPIQDGTTVLDVGKTPGRVTLSKPLVASTKACSFTFTRPVDDYASDAMIKLWYSWAQYYLTHWKDKTPSAPTAPTTIIGSIDAMTATMTFKEAHHELVKGMAVTGPGLDDAMTEVGRHQGDAVILTIGSDKKSVILSQVVANAHSDVTFTFLPPKSLLWTPTAEGDPGYPLIGDQFQFSDEPAWNNPYKFSQVAYLIMASMNQIGHENNDSVSKYMQDIVGANMGYIFTDTAKASFDANLVTSMIRDMIKSVLRGVSDFTKYPDVIDNQGNHTSWYPDPAKRTGGQMFNVFNLDPYVRFIHVNLGFSGYGFSVDDDTADVGGGGPSHLQLSVTGTGGLKKTSQWTIQAPYGPVKNVSLEYSGPATLTNGATLHYTIASVSNATPIVVTTVDPLPVPVSNGDTVVIDQVDGDPAANGTFKIGNVGRNTFALFDAVTGKTPVSPTGIYKKGGRWSYPLHAYIDSGADLTKVFYRVTGDDALGTFLGTFVSVNGVDQNKTTGVKFRVWQLGKEDVGQLILWADLTDANGSPLAKGTYNFTFFGIAEPDTAPPLQP